MVPRSKGVLLGFVLVIVIAVVLTVVGYRLGPQRSVPPSAPTPQPQLRDRVLFINSYHRGYVWSDEILAGFLDGLGARQRADGSIDHAHAKVRIRVVYMDTKRHPDADFIAAAAARVRTVIDEWQPDVLAVSDDNAVKHVVVPHVLGTGLPTVFCGVNWSAEAYGLPADNVTGMVGVALTEQLVDEMHRHAAGRRIAFLAGESVSNRISLRYFRERYGEDLVHAVFFRTVEEFPAALQEAQDAADMVLLGVPNPPVSGVEEPGYAQMEAAVREGIRLPIGAYHEWYASLALVSYAKDPREPGEWVAEQCLRILAGTRPEEISLARNRHASAILNMPLARKLGVLFDIDLIGRARLLAGGP